ncbi:hypothetical protein GQ457_01G023530 [Hibiscus cannabinus]
MVPPLVGWFKVCCNAAFDKETRKAATAVVVRDCTGAIIGGDMVFFSASLASSTEASAIMTIAKFSMEFGVHGDVNGCMVLNSVPVEASRMENENENETGENPVEGTFQQGLIEKMEQTSPGMEDIPEGIPTDEPYVGQEFESEAAAHAFYNGYATKVGFVIREHTHPLAPGKGRRDCIYDQYPNEHNKIRELTQQLAIEKKRAATYKRHLELIFEQIEEHNESLSKKIQHIVDHVHEMENKEHQNRV